MVAQQPTEKRPTFLLVICILSLVWMGFGALFGVGSLLIGPSSDKEMAEATADIDKNIAELRAQNMDSWVPTFVKLKHMTIQSNKKYYPMQITSILIFIVGIVAVVMMMQAKRLGFHFYIIYSLLGMLQYYFFLSPMIVPTFLIIISLVISGIFITMYAANLKWMR